MSSGREIWLPSLSGAGTRDPLLLEDTFEAGLASTASLALRDRHQSLIGAMGVAWARAQAFTDAQKDEVRVVAQLAGDALGRAQLLEAERAARQRTERLQRMMSALVASASLAEVTASVFEHGLLPFGASAARLVLVDQRQPERLVTVNAVGLPEPLLSKWRAYPLSDVSPSRRALETSEIVYVRSAADLAAEYPDASIGMHISGQQAWVAVPLRSSGRTLGVLTLVFARAHPLDDGPDQIALTALGSTIADALSRAIQHDSDRDLVISVQRSLLADTLPERPGVRLGGYYLPSETRYGIGGDWYDVVLRPDGQMTLIVGDVAGHGLEAAVTMGQMRSAARALAPDHGPAALLEALDRFLCSTVKEPLATAAVVVIDPITAQSVVFVAAEQEVLAVADDVEDAGAGVGRPQLGHHRGRGLGRPVDPAVLLPAQRTALPVHAGSAVVQRLGPVTAFLEPPYRQQHRLERGVRDFGAVQGALRAARHRELHARPDVSGVHLRVRLEHGHAPAPGTAHDRPVQ